MTILQAFLSLFFDLPLIKKITKINIPMSTLFTKIKLSVCGIQIGNYIEKDNPFSYDLFQDMLDTHIVKLPQIEEYKRHLWEWGFILFLDKLQFERDSIITFQYHIELLEKYKFLEDAIKSEKESINKTILQNHSFYGSRYAKAILEELKKEIMESGANKFCVIKKGETIEIVNSRDILRNPNVTNIYELTYDLEDRIGLEKKIKQLKDWKVLDGEGKRKKPVKKAVHIGIHALSLLLRIDEFIKNRKSHNSIIDINLSNNICRFIADFLIFFRIYKEENFSETSNPYLTIRNLYLNIPKVADPMLSNEIIKIRNYIDKEVSDNGQFCFLLKSYRIFQID